jgi:hypothetical protein
MSAFTPRRSARLAAKAQQTTPQKVNHVFTAASPADLKAVMSAPKKAPRDISHLFTPVVPSRLSIPMTPVKPKKAVYRSLADKLLDESESHRENLLRENIDTLIVHQLDAALRCIPKGRDVDAQTVFLYSFIVRPLLDSLTKPYVNWDKVPLADLYGIMYYWCPSARTVPLSHCMSDKFLHDWNVCRDRLVQYGLIFP